MPKGAFRRIGSTDQRCVDDDLWVLRGASQPLMGPDMAPAIAAVLHEINWAETKGSGIRTMRRLAGDAGLPLPEFAGKAGSGQPDALHPGKP